VLIEIGRCFFLGVSILMQGTLCLSNEFYFIFEDLFVFPGTSMLIKRRACLMIRLC
jgi:hypothetical protein